MLRQFYSIVNPSQWWENSQANESILCRPKTLIEEKEYPSPLSHFSVYSVSFILGLKETDLII